MRNAIVLLAMTGIVAITAGCASWLLPENPYEQITQSIATGQ